MRRLVLASSFLKKFRLNPLLHRGFISSGFSTVHPNIAIEKAVEYQFRFRTILKLSDLYDYVLKQAEDIKKFGKTILLEFLNEYPMQSFRRSRDELNKKRRQQNQKVRYNLYMFLDELEDLNFYELNMRYSIFKKILKYGGPDEIIAEKTQKYENELLECLKDENIHFLDVINWLYMLPLGYSQHLSTIAFDRLEKHMQKDEIRYYLKNQRSLPMLIKRIYEKDWSELRKYKKIIKFLCFEASLNREDNLENLVISFERISMLKLHIVGEKTIPKLIDELIDYFNIQFDQLCKNKQALLKVFSCFKYLPLNYNVAFFNKIHNYLKSVTELSSHCLLYLPYNKLSQSEVSFLQTKMFTTGREDIAPKLIYTVYAPEYKQILTPFLLKEVYNNFLEIWKRDNLQQDIYFQVYVALLFRFNRMNDPIIDQKKMKTIFLQLVEKVEYRKYQLFNVLSLSGMISFFELCKIYQADINQRAATIRVERVISLRKEKNHPNIWADFCILALKVHFNSKSQISRHLITSFLHDIVENPEVEKDTKSELLFLIEKTLRPEPKWAEYSQKLYQEVVTDIHAFVQDFVKYDGRTQKLTSFIFSKLYSQKVQLHVVLELLSSLNLKLITSLKGRLINPIKKYISQLQITNFDLSQCSLNCLTQSFRILFYFRHQISEFMQHMALSINRIIEQKLEQDEYINGKQFISLSCYIMEVLEKIDVRRKTEVIKATLAIIKKLRKREGLFIKVYELDFLARHQKYIPVNHDVIDQQWAEILNTLRKTDRIQYHKDLFLISIKLHCLQLVDMNSYDLRDFVHKCTSMIEDSVITLSQIKQCLGYEILNCEDQFSIEKIKIFLSEMIQIAFRKENKKQNYFIYEYYFKLFSKLSETHMVIEICQKILFEKLYPIEVSNILSILNQNQIKNKKLVLRILEIMKLSDSYVTFEKMQVLSWLDKIYYEIPEDQFKISYLRTKVNGEINARVLSLKEQQKTLLDQEERSVEEGYEVEDIDFDRNYKLFIQYAWSCIKHKQVSSIEFKYICRYFFFSIEKIKARIENPEQRKKISKIKLYHVIKYVKESGFFQVSEKKLKESVREKAYLMEKVMKDKLLSKMESYLSFIKFVKSEKLETKLAKMDGIQFKHKAQISLIGSKATHIAEYMINEINSSERITKKTCQFIIHTVKRYHYTKEYDVSMRKRISKTPIKWKVSQEINNSLDQTKLKEENDDIMAFEEVDDVEELVNDLEEDALEDDSVRDKRYLEILQNGLSLQMKPDQLSIQKKQTKEPKTIKPLFGQAIKKKNLSENPKAEQNSFVTSLKLEHSNSKLYENYNGYLRIEKSLIELNTGMKCIIYDPEKDIFFD